VVGEKVVGVVEEGFGALGEEVGGGDGVREGWGEEGRLWSGVVHCWGCWWLWRKGRVLKVIECGDSRIKFLVYPTFIT